TTSARSAAASTFGTASAVFLLIFQGVEMRCTGTEVRSYGDGDDGDQNGGNGNQPHPAGGAKCDESAKEQRNAGEDPDWTGDDVRSIPCFFGPTYIGNAQPKILVSRQAASGG